MLDELFENVEEISKLPKAVTDKNKLLLFLNEEIGEVATCFLVEEGLKHKTLTESDKEEAVDVLIVALRLYIGCGGSKEHLQEYSKKKLKKWRNRVIN